MIYMNRETGEVFLTKKAMLEDFALEYDGGDPTNPATWDEHYDEIPDPTPPQMPEEEPKGEQI